MPNPDGPDDEVIDTEAAPIPDGLPVRLPTRGDMENEAAIVGLHAGDPNISLSALRDFILEYEDDIDEELDGIHEEISEVIPDSGIEGEVSANAVGVQPHSSVKLIADKETTVVYVNVARDNSNYEKCMDVAVQGQAAKLSGSNVRVGMLKIGKDSELV